MYSVIWAAVYETEGREWMTCFHVIRDQCEKDVKECERVLGPAWAKDNVLKRIVRVECKEVGP